MGRRSMVVVASAMPLLQLMPWWLLLLMFPVASALVPASSMTLLQHSTTTTNNNNNICTLQQQTLSQQQKQQQHHHYHYHPLYAEQSSNWQEIPTSADEKQNQHQKVSSSLKHGLQHELLPQPRRRRRCDPCRGLVDDTDNNNNKSVETDRREAAFAMLGALWAVGGVSGLISTSLLFGNPQLARAAYGDEAKLVLPNPLEALSDRATKQCLVESLGNRECLVYLEDEMSRLYQGADTSVLIQRLQQAAVALATIPDLIASKKWSSVQSVLTGPMGTLVTTMNQLILIQQQQQGEASSSASTTTTTTTNNNNRAEQLAKKVKQDLYDIAAAADRKQGDVALKSQQQATNDLLAFLKALEA